MSRKHRLITQSQGTEWCHLPGGRSTAPGRPLPTWRPRRQDGLPNRPGKDGSQWSVMVLKLQDVGNIGNGFKFPTVPIYYQWGQWESESCFGCEIHFKKPQCTWETSQLTCAFIGKQSQRVSPFNKANQAVVSSVLVACISQFEFIHASQFLLADSKNLRTASEFKALVIGIAWELMFRSAVNLILLSQETSAFLLCHTSRTHKYTIIEYWHCQASLCVDCCNNHQNSHRSPEWKLKFRSSRIRAPSRKRKTVSSLSERLEPDHQLFSCRKPVLANRASKLLHNHRVFHRAIPTAVDALHSPRQYCRLDLTTGLTTCENIKIPGVHLTCLTFI